MPSGLELIGNPAKGRPTLGEKAPVAMFRALRLIGVMEGLDSTIGDASTLVYTSGKGLGLQLGNSILSKTGKNLDNYAKEVANAVRDLGVGILSITKLDLPGSFIRLQVEECITCAGMPNIGKKVCHFEAGFVSGVLEAFIGKAVNVKETKCWGMGDKVCEFEATF